MKEYNRRGLLGLATAGLVLAGSGKLEEFTPQCLVFIWKILRGEQNGRFYAEDT